MRYMMKITINSTFAGLLMLGVATSSGQTVAIEGNKHAGGGRTWPQLPALEQAKCVTNVSTPNNDRVIFHLHTCITDRHWAGLDPLTFNFNGDSIQ